MWAWVKSFEDLSGVDGGKHCDNEEFLREVMEFAREVYLPFLAASSDAVVKGEDSTQVTLWPGSSSPINHVQPSFKYQHKCLLRIKESFARLSSSEQETVKQMIGNSLE